MFDKPDIYSPLNLTPGPLLEYLRVVCLSKPPTSCTLLQRVRKIMMRVYLLLICLMPLLMCQAEAAPEPRDRIGHFGFDMVNGVRGKN
jgi:hypothetical protein